ncbi:MAG: hypothetical protein ACFFDT_00425, partial [Candidatus Hodarchaeota archaeon]
RGGAHGGEGGVVEDLHKDEEAGPPRLGGRLVCAPPPRPADGPGGPPAPRRPRGGLLSDDPRGDEHDAVRSGLELGPTSVFFTVDLVELDNMEETISGSPISCYGDRSLSFH